MKTPELRHLLTIQEPVRTPDGGGGFTTAWQDIATGPAVYAAIEPLPGREELRQGQMTPVQSWRITLRYRADITPALRLAEGATIYNITSVRDIDGRAAYLEILAASP